MELEPSLIILILILITALISLSLSLILHHLNRQCIRRLSQSSLASASVAAESRSFASIRVSPETAAISLIESLPRFTFSSVRRCSNSTSCSISGDCAICLSKFEPPDQLRLLPPCSHAFHVDCVDKWLISNIACPLCRSPVQTSDPDFLRALQASSSAPATADAGASAVSAQGSLRIEIGSISRREVASEIEDHRTSYSLGSFEYVMQEELEISLSNSHLENVSHKEAGSGSSNWLMDYLDRISSASTRAFSFCSSGRFLSRSNRIEAAVNMDLEVGGASVEIIETFRWHSEA